MAVESRTETERIAAARERYVARGVATPPLVVARAEGARVWDVDGKEYVDFAGGLGCHNLGQGAPGVVAAIHEQADRYLHQCFMVGIRTKLSAESIIRLGYPRSAAEDCSTI